VLVDAIRDLLEARFRDKPIQVEINGLPFAEPRDPLVFNFALVTMEVILENLLSNAMKYGDRIQVQAADKGATVQVAIIDNGQGFDVEELRNLLLVPRDRPELSSTQLGLRVTLHLLEKCCGRLLVSSQPRAGSNFTWSSPNSCSLGLSTIPRNPGSRLALCPPTLSYKITIFPGSGCAAGRASLP
jgi:signal transduction histidine kinase